jgi:tetrapyrrole methylase family protein/MazG family protein
MLTVIGMGIGKEDALTLGALEKVRGAKRVVLQTADVPVAAFLQKQNISFETLDGIYKSAEDFDALVSAAVSFMTKDEDTAFLVLGAVYANELAKAVLKRADAKVIPGVSLFEYALSLCKISSEGAVTFAAADVSKMRINTNLATVITGVADESLMADTVLALSRFYSEEYEGFLIRGSEAQKMTLKSMLNQKDLAFDCSVAVDKLALKEKNAYTFDDLVSIMDILRAPDGCPWDREQTHASLRQYLLEECYEVIDAIDQKDPYLLSDELGDVLLQIAFHAHIAKDHGTFDDVDITTNICTKMISRHTHVFKDDKIFTAQGVVQNWEKLKLKERGLDSYAQSMKDFMEISALLKAAKIQKKAALAGFDWPSYHGALDKLEEEIQELLGDLKDEKDPEEEAGDILFAAVNLLRLLKVNPEIALNRANKKFIGRFEYIEKSALSESKELKDMSLEELDKLWDESKLQKDSGMTAKLKRLTAIKKAKRVKKSL